MGGVSDPRNESLIQMFNLINVGERAGSGLPSIRSVWQKQGWQMPEIVEAFNPDRTTLTLPLSAAKMAVKSGGNSRPVAEQRKSDILQCLTGTPGASSVQIADAECHPQNLAALKHARKYFMPKKSKKSRKPSSMTGSAALERLYEAAVRILMLQPWNHFSSKDLFIQYPKNGERMILACTVNSLAEGFGVLVYPNPAFCPDSVLSSDTSDISEREYIESEEYTLFFDAWSELPASAQKSLTSIGITPIKSMLYPWFSHKTFGHPRADLSPADYPIFSDILGNLIMQYRRVLEQGLLVDFAAGQALVRVYDAKADLWYNFASKMKFAPKAPVSITMQDDSPNLTALRNCPVNTKIPRVEFDFGWEAEPVVDEEGKTPYYRMLVLFADRISGKKLTYYSCHPDDFMDAAFTAWEELIQQYGRPQTLYLSRPESVGLFQDFANKVSVKVKIVKRLPAIQRLFRQNGII